MTKLTSNIFKVKDELTDQFVQNLEEHINIVLTGEGFYVFTEDGQWPQYRYQPEDQSYHDFDLAEAIVPYLQPDQVIYLPDAPPYRTSTLVTAEGQGFNVTFPNTSKPAGPFVPQQHLSLDNLTAEANV